MSARDSLEDCGYWRAELELVTDAFARVVGWTRDPDAMESESEMAEIADAALFRAREALDHA